MYELVVRQNRPSGEGMHHLICAAPSGFSAQYRNPGQFTNIGLGGQSSPFAFASAPGEMELEFLIKYKEGIAARLCGVQERDIILADTVSGRGFDLRQVVGRPLHLFSMGSGIAPLRAVIGRFLIGQLSLPQITLWQGSYSPKYLPFAYEYAMWESKGIKMKICFDNKAPPKSLNVVEMVRAERPLLEEAAACWAGSEDFGSDLQAATSALGLPRELFLDNLA